MKRVVSIICLTACLFLSSCSEFLGRYGDSGWSGPPRGRGFQINGGDEYAYATACVLSMDVDGAAEMRFCNQDDEWSVWTVYADSNPWRIVYGNGEKTVLAEFRSADGLVRQLHDTIYFIDKSAPPGAAADDRWGASVSLSGDGMAFVAGAPGFRSGTLVSMGAAALSTRPAAASPDLLGDWTAMVFSAANVYTGEQRSSAEFGSSVALSGDGSMIIVGAPSDSLNYIDCGTSFLFPSGGLLTDGERKDSLSKAYQGYFGSSVSISYYGTRALVGAIGNDSYSQYGGRTYFYDYSGGIWSGETTLGIPSGLATGDNFGFSVSISGDGQTAAVGAYTANSGEQQSGYVYIYDLDDPDTPVVVAPLEPVEFGFFGFSVSLNYDGDRCAIGARGERVSGVDNAGAVYIYDRGAGWTLTKKIVAFDGAEMDYFGYSVSLSSSTASNGTVLAVGAQRADGAYTDMGAVYAFGKDIGGTDAWDPIGSGKFTARDGAFNDMLGYSVSCSADGEWIAAGAPGDDEDGLEDRGSVYIFHLE